MHGILLYKKLPVLTLPPRITFLVPCPINIRVALLLVLMKMIFDLKLTSVRNRRWRLAATSKKSMKLASTLDEVIAKR